MSLQAKPPTPDGSIERAPGVKRDYRRSLRSRRWAAAELANPEVNTANPWLAVGLIALLAAGTFVILVLGYATHFFG